MVTPLWMKSRADTTSPVCVVSGEVGVTPEGVPEAEEQGVTDPLMGSLVVVPEDCGRTVFGIKKRYQTTPAITAPRRIPTIHMTSLVFMSNRLQTSVL